MSTTATTIAALAAMLANANVVVRTPQGTVQGVGAPDGSSTGGQAFYGMRYAMQPARFWPSTEYTRKWKEKVYDASSQAPACWAPTGFPCFLDPALCVGTALMSEDCLFLDIYRPANLTVGERVPVMVWLHGGGMVVGNSADHNATHLAVNGRVIVVSVNYRLGPLGFLVDREIEARGDGNGGMNGIRDQITALAWVKRNIESFGGSPDNVTVFGVSAGGLSTCSLLLSPLASGLMARAIIESGSCLGPWGPGSAEHGLAVAARLKSAVGAPTLAALEAMPPWSLMWSSWSEDGADIEFTGHWRDGVVLPASPLELLARGSINAAAVMLGGNSRDGVSVPPTYGPPSDWPNTTAEYSPLMRRHWRQRNATGGLQPTVRTLSRDSPDDVIAAYPTARFGGNAAAAFKAADGDYNVVCPARVIADWIELSGRSAFLFYFTHGPLDMQPACGGNPPSPGQPNVVSGWANHGAEQAFVFGDWAAGGPCVYSQPEQDLSASIQRYWTSFARTGDPNMHRVWGAAENAAPFWQSYGSSGGAMQLEEVPMLGMIGGFGDVVKSGGTVNCEFWDSFTDRFNDTRN